jgi:hypothetical protein
MCERCRALDREIESFRRLHEIADDPLALTLLAEAIADLKTEKPLYILKNSKAP